MAEGEKLFDDFTSRKRIFRKAKAGRENESPHIHRGSLKPERGKGKEATGR